MSNLMLNHATDPNHYFYKFDSVSDMAQQLAIHGRHHTNVPRCQSHDTSLDTNGMNQHEATEIAARGGDWEEGARDLLSTQLPDTAEQLTGYTLAPSIETQCAGFMPNVPAMLTGEPEQMFELVQANQSQKVINIGINTARAWYIKDEESLNIGRAILSVVRQLQLEGYAVAIDVVWYATKELIQYKPFTPCPTAENPLVEIATNIKQSHEHFSPASLAFAVSSTAFCRRLCWQVTEHNPALDAFRKSGYGVGVGAVNPRYDVWIPYLTKEHNEHMATPEAAAKWITGLVAAAIGGDK